MIPKIIHYCWFGRNPLPDSVMQYIESWKRFCPDFEIRQWNEDNFDINKNRYCREAYEAKKWAFVTDYARLKILYEYGGIYMDSDVEVVKPLDDLLSYNAFSGFEGIGRIPTGTMAAVAGNEWIELLLRDYDEKRFILPDGSLDLTTNVTYITNLTSEKYSLCLDGEMQIFGNNMAMLPFDYLCAKSCEDGKILRTENTYTIHHFAGSWLGPVVQYRINTENRWVKASEIMPWDVLEQQFPEIIAGLEAPFPLFRLILGILLIQDQYGFSDEEMLDQFIENIYFQYFCGIKEPVRKLPFDSTVLEHVHKQCSALKMESIKMFIKNF